jgi:hypothetical protein
MDFDVPCAERMAAGIVSIVEENPAGVARAAAGGIGHFDTEEVTTGPVDRCLSVDASEF